MVANQVEKDITVNKVGRSEERLLIVTLKKEGSSFV